MLEEVDRNTEAQLSKRIPDDNLRIFIKNVNKKKKNIVNNLYINLMLFYQIQDN
jgi:hypothetical protein